MLRKYDDNDLLAKMFLLFFALLHGITGVYLVVVDGVELQAATYYGMASLFSLDVWGCVFIAVGVLFVATSFQEGHVKHWLAIFAGTLGTVIFGLYAMASAELAVNSLISSRYALIASFNAIIAVIGGRAIWIRKR
jgi:hypothetical protein